MPQLEKGSFGVRLALVASLPQLGLSQLLDPPTLGQLARTVLRLTEIMAIAEKFLSGILKNKKIKIKNKQKKPYETPTFTDGLISHQKPHRMET